MVDTGIDLVSAETSLSAECIMVRYHSAIEYRQQKYSLLLRSQYVISKQIVDQHCLRLKLCEMQT